MSDNHEVRVLVIDNDARLERHLVPIIQAEGYSVQFLNTDGLRSIDELKPSVEERAKVFRPHVAIVDLRLLDDYTDETSGLEVAPLLESAERLLYSAYLTPDVTRPARELGYRDWVRKGDIDDLLTVVANLARFKSSIQRGCDVTWPSGFSLGSDCCFFLNGEKKSDVSWVSLFAMSMTDLVSQLLPTEDRIAISALNGKMTEPPVIRRRSIIGRTENAGRRPLILKLTDRDHALREIGRYKKFVEDQQPALFSTQFRHSALFWDWGGIAYSFLGNGDSPLPTFSQHYQANTDANIILAPIRHFFDEVWAVHYNDREELGCSLFESYDKMLGLQRKFRKIKRTSKPAGFPMNVKPQDWVSTTTEPRDFPGFLSAVVHGDFHSDNIFVNQKSSWVIDFERTGRYHILADFVELEVDILTRLLPELGENDLLNFYSLVQLLTEPEMFPEDGHTLAVQVSEQHGYEEIVKATDVIAQLRTIAHQVTSVGNVQEYLWGVLLDSVFVLTMVDSVEEKQLQRAWILAAVCCQRLDSDLEQGGFPVWIEPSDSSATYEQ